MRRLAFTLAIVVSLLSVPHAQQSQSTLYIPPTGDGFEVYLAAAMMKKGVPVTVLDHEDGAKYVLRAAQVETKKVGGGSKRGQKNRQSMAEAVAKHLKNDFFHR